MTYDSAKSSRVLMLSQRNLSFHVSRCWMYEFEDAICTFDIVDLVAPTYSSKLLHRLVDYTTKSIGIGKFCNPGIDTFQVSKDYELFIACFQNPSEILSLNSFRGWRKRCYKAICWLDEIWVKDLETWKHHLELLKDFDHIFLNFSFSVEAVSDIVQRSCHFIPYGVDSLNFCPFPLPAHRCIDIYSIGRRSQITHAALLELVKHKQFFYIYETIKGLRIIDHREHRSLFSNLIKRSRYFIANTAKFDDTNLTGNQQELSTRFFEAAAGGAIILGTPPNCEAFYSNFDWSDAVFRLPYDAAEVADIIANLDAQPERLARVRRDNVINSLLRHDWLYRWAKILDTVGLEGTPQMISRKSYLKSLTELVTNYYSCI